MRVDILTLFPDIFTPLKQSIIGRASEAGKVEINTVNIRDFSTDKHKKCDDTPYGGGEGMVMTPQPLWDALESVIRDDSRVIYLSPKGKTLKHATVRRLSENPHLVLICGHYEGIDQRIIDHFVDEEISIGDYVLTGGELPAMVLVDAVCRFLPGVLGNSDSAENESFSDGLLEYPQYTRPAEFKGLKVPEVLQKGNHSEIAKWRKHQSVELTKARRPDLLEKKKQ